MRKRKEGKERRRVSGSKCKMRQTKRFTYTRALPAAATWVEPRGASHRHRHRRLARFDALISYLVCCLYLFCRLGERMHPSRMKSCSQQGASDCKLCKLRCRGVHTVSANCLPTSICVLASGNATTRKSVVVVVVFPCVCISSSSYPPTLSIYLYIHLSIYVSVKL